MFGILLSLLVCVVVVFFPFVKVPAQPIPKFGGRCCFVLSVFFFFAVGMWLVRSIRQVSRLLLT